MIIQPSHSHDHADQSQQQPQPTEGILPLFTALLHNSQSLLNEKSIKQTQHLRRYYEQKVYLSYCDDPSQYLLHMLHKSQSENGDQVAQLIMGRQNRVVGAIRSDKYEVRVNNQGEKLRKIKDQLAGKIGEMRSSMADLDGVGERSQERTQEIYKGYMEFRKRGYWNQQSEQAKKVKRFLGKMRKERQKIEQFHERNLKKIDENIQEQEQKQRKAREQEQKRIFQQLSKRREKVKSQRKHKVEEHKKRLVEASSLVQKFKSEKPVYILNEQKFKKEVIEPMQQQKKRKLNEIKKNRKPIDASQLELHSQRYEQFKQKLLETYEKREQDNELYQKNMQKLKQLYHGHYHQKIQQEMNQYQDMLQEKRKIREKISSYSAGIKEEFKPKIDSKKREELESLRKLLEMKDKEKGKKKIKNQDGSIVFEEISPDQHKKLGVSYLEYLRKFNEGKKRKQPEDRSASMMDLSKKKIIYPDYLTEMRSKSRIETSTAKSRSGWRKIISQEGYSNRDKYNSVMDHVSLLQHEARQKELELKYMKGGSKALELKEKLDKYYLESVAAKMQVLKDVILKQ